MKTPKIGEEDDFLDFMTEHRAHCVVMVERVDPSDITGVNRYWETLPSFPHVNSKYKVEQFHFHDGGCYTLHLLKFRRHESTGAFHRFVVFHCYMSHDIDVPQNDFEFVNFVTHTKIMCRRLNKLKSVCRIIVHNDGGVGFAAMYTAIEIGKEDVLCSDRATEILRVLKKNPHLRDITRKQMYFVRRALRTL
uniref:AsIV-cont00106-ORF1 n=1 Tax=Apophua simplicipes ichnovirus TaxID=1329648 RepID=S5DMP1_9VIRU|nr:AsIV-cont00106-ORF1 [Apophua simplicipes ichnovirus]